ncbi:MAG TPA: biopolymer transporter ExbD [Gammaproteobacteria bacterium]|nr:biopolymer transporter ExbD [Gammaproteobacteria bacterium]
MKFKENDAGDDDLQINLTPLIDIVFLLLIFFMVTTTFTRESQLRIQLPEAQAEDVKVEEVEQLVIEISALGVYAVKGPKDKAARQVINSSSVALKRVLDKSADVEKRDDLVVIVRADRKTPHEAVIRALSVARQSGLTRITFATQNEPDGG